MAAGEIVGCYWRPLKPNYVKHSLSTLQLGRKRCNGFSSRRYLPVTVFDRFQRAVGNHRGLRNMSDETSNASNEASLVDAPPLRLQQQIDLICEEFIGAWIAGLQPRIESYLNQLP